MLTHTLSPRVHTSPAIRDLTAEDVTVIMPVYDRVKYLRHYLKEGFWEGSRLQIVCDGSDENVLPEFQHLAFNQKHVDIYSYIQNRGPAFARTAGINRATTQFISFCDDDDFMTDASTFLQDACQKLASDEDILFVTAPAVYAFDESLNLTLQYNRRRFHGRTGRELLTFLVKTGEMCALSVGSVYWTQDVKGIYPDSFFKVSEDYTFLARLCARFPDRKVHVDMNCAYMRLIQSKSLSSRSNYSLEKIVMHLISMFVGAYHLYEMEILQLSMFKHILIGRGKVLKESYGKGAEATEWLANLLDKKVIQAPTAEQQETYDFLQKMRSSLPEEFLWLVGWNSSNLSMH